MINNNRKLTGERSKQKKLMIIFKVLGQSKSTILMGESNTIASAYTLYRHLQ